MLHSVFMVFLSHKKLTKIVTGLLKWVWHPPNFLVSFILYINISDKIVLSDARWRFSNLFSVMFSFYNFIPSKITKKNISKSLKKDLHWPNLHLLFMIHVKVFHKKVT